MRSSKGFTLEPMGGNYGASPDLRSKKAMMGTQNGFGQGAALPNNQQFAQDKMFFLEDENSKLKQQVQQMMKEIRDLKEENMELKTQITSTPGVKLEAKNEENTFITKGADSPTVVCENCSKEIDKKNYKLHFVYCAKNITKCLHCQEPVNKNEMEQHIAEQSGSDSQIQEAALNARYSKLRKMQQHGQSLEHFRDAKNLDNTIMHFAVKLKNRELIEFLNSEIPALIDVQNKNGEAPLHLVCGQDSDMELARFLVLHGAQTNSKNALGDTPESLAKRCGNMELVLLLSANEQQARASASFTYQQQPSNQDVYGTNMVQHSSPMPQGKAVQIKTRVGSSSQGPGMRRTRSKFNPGGGLPPQPQQQQAYQF